MTHFTHLDGEGNAHMVDITAKTASTRRAEASARVVFPPEVYQALRAADGQSKKGSVLATAQLAGIMAAKQTAQLIPLCHPLPLDQVDVQIRFDDAACAVNIRAQCRTTHKTGVEMEALTAASVAALTVYDMTKAMSHDIVIEQICLQAKSGGKRDFSRENS